MAPKRKPDAGFSSRPTNTLKKSRFDDDARVTDAPTTVEAGPARQTCSAAALPASAQPASAGRDEPIVIESSSDADSEHRPKHPKPSRSRAIERTAARQESPAPVAGHRRRRTEIEAPGAVNIAAVKSSAKRSKRGEHVVDDSIHAYSPDQLKKRLTDDSDAPTSKKSKFVPVAVPKAAEGDNISEDAPASKKTKLVPAAAPKAVEDDNISEDASVSKKTKLVPAAEPKAVGDDNVSEDASASKKSQPVPAAEPKVVEDDRISGDAPASKKTKLVPAAAPKAAEDHSICEDTPAPKKSKLVPAMEPKAARDDSTSEDELRNSDVTVMSRTPNTKVRKCHFLLKYFHSKGTILRPDSYGAHPQLAYNPTDIEGFDIKDPLGEFCGSIPLAKINTVMGALEENMCRLSGPSSPAERKSTPAEWDVQFMNRQVLESFLETLRIRTTIRMYCVSKEKMVQLFTKRAEEFHSSFILQKPKSKPKHGYWVDEDASPLPKVAQGHQQPLPVPWKKRRSIIGRADDLAVRREMAKFDPPKKKDGELRLIDAIKASDKPARTQALSDSTERHKRACKPVPAHMPEPKETLPGKFLDPTGRRRKPFKPLDGPSDELTSTTIETISTGNTDAPETTSGETVTPRDADTKPEEDGQEESKNSTKDRRARMIDQLSSVPSERLEMLDREPLKKRPKMKNPDNSDSKAASPTSTTVERSLRSSKRPNNAGTSTSEAEPHKEKEPVIAGMDVGPQWENEVYYPRTGPNRAIVGWQDVGCLNVGEELNDNIINFGLRWISEHTTIKDKVHYFNTHFYSTLTTPGTRGINYNGIRNWTKKVDIFDKDYVVVPVHADNHWFLVVICGLPNLARTPTEEGEAGSSDFGENELGGSDSKSECTKEVQPPASSTRMSMRGRSGVSSLGRREPRSSGSRMRAPDNGATIIVMDSLGITHPSTIAALRSYIKEEGRAKRSLEIAAGDLRGTHGKVPHQQNDSDCGVYLLGYAEELFGVNPQTDDLLEGRLQWPEFEPSAMRGYIRGWVLQARGPVEGAVTKDDTKEDLRGEQGPMAPPKAMDQGLLPQQQSLKAPKEGVAETQAAAQGNLPVGSPVDGADSPKDDGKELFFNSPVHPANNAFSAKGDKSPSFAESGVQNTPPSDQVNETDPASEAPAALVIPAGVTLAPSKKRARDDDNGPAVVDPSRSSAETRRQSYSPPRGSEPVAAALSQELGSAAGPMAGGPLQTLTSRPQTPMNIDPADQHPASEDFSSQVDELVQVMSSPSFSISSESSEWTPDPKGLDRTIWGPWVAHLDGDGDTMMVDAPATPEGSDFEPQLMDWETDPADWETESDPMVWETSSESVGLDVQPTIHDSLPLEGGHECQRLLVVDQEIGMGEDVESAPGSPLSEEAPRAAEHPPLDDGSPSEQPVVHPEERFVPLTESEREGTLQFLQYLDENWPDDQETMPGFLSFEEVPRAEE